MQIKEREKTEKQLRQQLIERKGTIDELHGKLRDQENIMRKMEAEFQKCEKQLRDTQEVKEDELTGALQLVKEENEYLKLEINEIKIKEASLQTSVKHLTEQLIFLKTSVMPGYE